MNFHEDSEGRRRRKPQIDAPSSDSEADAKMPQKPRKKGRPEVGHALRSAYQRMVDEDIPPDLLDLLGKLG